MDTPEGLLSARIAPHSYHMDDRERGPGIKPLLIAYLRVRATASVPQIRMLCLEASDFALREGYTLAEVFVATAGLTDVLRSAGLERAVARTRPSAVLMLWPSDRAGWQEENQRWLDALRRRCPVPILTYGAAAGPSGEELNGHRTALGG